MNTDSIEERFPEWEEAAWKAYCSPDPDALDTLNLEMLILADHMRRSVYHHTALRALRLCDEGLAEMEVRP